MTMLIGITEFVLAFWLTNRACRKGILGMWMSEHRRLKRWRGPANIPPLLAARAWARAEATCDQCDWWAATDRGNWDSILQPRLLRHLESTGHHHGRVR